jgi:hypothetical protein
MKKLIMHAFLMVLLILGHSSFAADTRVNKQNNNTVAFPIVDTGQTACYDNSMKIACPGEGEGFYGQDANYMGKQPNYKDNNDGTVIDNNTGLMWQKDPGKKKTFTDAVAGVSKFKLAGYKDWRLPTIKELYSLILFSGIDPDPRSATMSSLQPFIDSKYFDFVYGDPNKNERIIDSQFLSSTKYVHFTMHNDETIFGVNFADGRIKGYPRRNPRGRGEKGFFVLHVRGNPGYGKNAFIDNGNNTITDKATGLMWMKFDSGYLKAGKNKNGSLNWQQALEWAENLVLAGYSDWRLPNVKELQGIVDYSRSPATTNSAAIDPVFNATVIIDESGQKNYPFYWSGTTHARLHGGNAAAYVAFGSSLGWMRNPRNRNRELLDVHGAGSQRSDPKIGDPSRFPYGRGPQGDVIRIYNHVRCVRDER